MATSYRNKSDDSSSNSDSDSENDCEVWKRGAKPSFDSKPMCVLPQNQELSSDDNTFVKKRKTNNIWSEVVMENDMTDTIGNVGLKEIPKNAQDRSCESYDFTRRQLDTRPFPDDELYMDSEDIHSNDRSSIPNTKYMKLNKDDGRIAKTICWKLCEPKKYLIYRTVGIIGATKALEILKQTEDVEENGGMLVKNSSRRRTPGGVYFTLLKDCVSEEQKNKIFEGEGSQKEFYREKKALMKSLGMKLKNKKHKLKKKKANKKPADEEVMDMESSDVKQNQNGSESVTKHVTFADELYGPDALVEHNSSGNGESSVENLHDTDTSKNASSENASSENSDVEDGEILD